MLQSYLYRTFVDVEHMNTLHARVRICKGAYKEPASVAYPDKKNVDANYIIGKSWFVYWPITSRLTAARISLSGSGSSRRRRHSGSGSRAGAGAGLGR